MKKLALISIIFFYFCLTIISTVEKLKTISKPKAINNIINNE